MKIFFWKSINVVFHLICVITLLVFTYQLLKNYHKNANSLNVRFRRFQSNKSSVYPSVSMCFTSPFLSKKLERFAEGLSPSQYSDFIMGKTDYTSHLGNISHQEVSLQIDDFLVSASISSKTKEVSEQQTSIVSNITSVHLSVFVWRFLKCFTFNIPYDESIIISQLVIELNRKIFPNNTRPMNGWAENFGLSLYYHLPNQLFKSYPTRKLMWPKETLESYSTFTYIANIELITLRQIKKDSCIDSRNYDEWFIKQVILSVGCSPPYWTTNLRVPKCNTKEKLKEVSEELWNRFYGKIDVPLPCTKVQRIDVEYLDTEPWDSDSNNSLYFPIFFRDTTYKDISQVRAYTSSDLFGDIGGFVGLLLGYAIVQLPTLVRNFFSFLTSEEHNCRIVLQTFLKGRDNN